MHRHMSGLYRLISRQPNPFSEHLNKVPFTESNTDGKSMAEKIVSIFGNDSLIDVIVIEDTVDSTQLPPTVFTNNPNVGHIYRVRIDEQMKQHAVQYDYYVDNVTSIKLDRWDRLSFNGPGIFSAICKGTVLTVSILN